MSGLRQEGILQVNDTGGGGPSTPVEITNPVGQQPMADSVSVVIASDQTPIPVSLAGVVTASGTITSTITPVELTLNGQQGAGLRFTTTDFDGLLVIQTTYDGTNWFNIPFVVVASGNIATGVTFTGGVASGNLSFVIPGGITEVRAATQTHNSGSLTVVIQATATQEFTPQYVGAESEIAPQRGLQVGGAAALNGEWHNVRVQAENPGINILKYGMIVVPWGKVEAGASATGYPFQLVAGRDPITNMMRQLDVTVAALTAGLHGLVTRPYTSQDGLGNTTPIMDGDARRGFQEITRWLGSTAPTVGQKTKANSLPVTIASDQGSFGIIIQYGTSGGVFSVDGISGFIEIDPTAQGVGISLNNSGLTGTISVEASVDSQFFENIPSIKAGVIAMSHAFVADSSFHNIGAIIPNGTRYIQIRMSGHSAGSTDYNIIQTSIPPFQTWLGSVEPTVGQKVMASSIPVVLPSNQTAIPVNTKTDLTPSSPTAVSVGVASALAVAANATRKGLKLINTSNARISLGLGAAAVLDSGITLYPGGVFNMDEYDFDLGAVNAIASAAASNLAIQEFTT